MRSPSYRLLIADEEDRVRRLIKLYANGHDAATEEAVHGEQALTMALERPYDIILLDVKLRDISGPEVCRLLKSMKSTPVILLSRQGDESDKLLGFEAGADDYVAKPFSPRELMHRINAILRRTRPMLGPERPIHTAETAVPQLLIDHRARRIVFHGQELSLTLKEYDLLRQLALHEGITFTREALVRRVWKHQTDGSCRTVDSHIKRIRGKLDAIRPYASSIIRTVWGVGYRLDASATEDNRASIDRR
ncbi:response regulator transcription factor [Paenibacillus filicis]|uniref:Response regulator transcription factor n=1 Tax=Paenibacillus filicis TaxID=669464 RepID=A0ABU9DT52_9BACL